MKHLGDITKIKGSNVPTVNVIIGGSPCQDLSVAGKRAGLAGERSGLFMEQIRIIKEMREESERSGATDIKPRFMVWENVPGALSSNKGQDFRAVLEETARIVEKNLPDLPIPSEGWHYSGLLMGEGWTVAWRVFDAQFWGVPQRRRRIALVADFGGCTAPEILFERKGVSRHTPPSGTPWEIFAATLAKRFGGADKARENSELAYCIQGVRERCGCEGGGKGLLVQEEKSGTLAANNDQFVVAHGFPLGFRPENVKTYEEAATTICCGTRAGHCNGVIAIDRAAFNQGENAQYDFEVSENGVNSTLTAKGPSAVCGAFNANMGGKAHGIGYEEEKSPTLSAARHDAALVTPQSTVRRLTPLECERLQGFPDDWTDIGTEYIGTDGKKRKVSDSARYKALGNSIALPPWAWLLERLSFYCDDDCTMASLFDGIGGFPLIWETLNGKGSCLWASEIEEFPIAVTKHHFKEG